MKLVVIAWAPPPVRAKRVEAWARGLIWRRAWFGGGSRVVAPAGDSLSFASPKEKATPSLRPLRGAKGQTCVVSVTGCAVELALRCARRSDNHGELDNEAWALRRPCSPRNRPAAGAASRGWTAENIQTAARAIAALGLGVVSGCSRCLGLFLPTCSGWPPDPSG